MASKNLANSVYLFAWIPTLLILAAYAIFGGGCARGLPATHGIANFGEVAPGVWRGAQPSESALVALRPATVINLRDDPLDWEPRVCKASRIVYEAFPMSGIHKPSTDRLRRAEALLGSSTRPVFVHCEYGADRTGVVIACWRVQAGWTNADAFAEAKRYGLSPWLPEFEKAILEFKPATSQSYMR